MSCRLANSCWLFRVKESKNCLLPWLAVQREALGFLKMSATIYRSTWRISPEDLKLQVIFGLNLMWRNSPTYEPKIYWKSYDGDSCMSQMLWMGKKKELSVMDKRTDMTQLIREFLQLFVGNEVKSHKWVNEWINKYVNIITLGAPTTVIRYSMRAEWS